MLEALRQRVPPRRIVIGAIAVLFALIALVAGCSWLTRAQAPTSQADLLRMIAEARDSLDGPGRSVEVAAKALDTPEAALAFVRDQVVLADYQYRRLDPDAALAFRSANGVDKAALLAALITAQGYEAQVYYADWPRDVMPVRATGLKVPEEMQTLIRAMGTNRDPERRVEIERRGAALRSSVEQASARVEPLVHGAANDRGAYFPRYRYWVRAAKTVGRGGISIRCLPVSRPIRAIRSFWTVSSRSGLNC